MHTELSKRGGVKVSEQ